MNMTTNADAKIEFQNANVEREDHRPDQFGAERDAALILAIAARHDHRMAVLLQDRFDLRHPAAAVRVRPLCLRSARAGFRKAPARCRRAALRGGALRTEFRYFSRICEVMVVLPAEDLECDESDVAGLRAKSGTRGKQSSERCSAVPGWQRTTNAANVSASSRSEALVAFSRETRSPSATYSRGGGQRSGASSSSMR